MSKKDDQSPATKQDVGLLMGRMGELYDANERWKDEILAANKGWKNEIIHEFHIVAEDIRHDVGGAQSDRITAVEHDIVRLKKHTGFVA